MCRHRHDPAAPASWHPLSSIQPLANGSPKQVVEALERSQADIDERMVELLIAKHNVNQLLNNYRFSAHHAIYDTIILEHIPEKHFLYFDVFNENAVKIGEDVDTVLEEWEINLRLTKRHMIKSGIPLALFHNVGCLVSQKNLLRRRLEISRSFIAIDDTALAERYGAQVRPSGTYLTMYKKSYSEPDGTHKVNAEREGLIALLDYAQEHKMTLIGDYYGIIIGETPVFGYEGREMLLKLEIPVSYDGTSL